MKKYIITFILLFAFGLLAGGSVLIWMSTVRTCMFWSYTDNYKLQKCDYCYKFIGALIDCNSTYTCACQDINFKISCLNMPTKNRFSKPDLLFGIIFLLIGFLFIIIFVIFYFSMKENFTCFFKPKNDLTNSMP